MRNTSSAALVAIMALCLGTVAIAGVPGETFLRGDVDGDGTVDVEDVFRLSTYLRRGKSIPVPVLEALDVQDDGRIDDGDCFALSQLLARGTPARREVLDFIPGDVVPDGRLDLRDYRTLEAVILHNAPLQQTPLDAGDLNRDGRLDARDLRELRRRLARGS